MKRVPEFTCGLIGSILGILSSLFWFIAWGFAPWNDQLATIAWISNGIGVLISIVAIVFSCLINKYTKLSSIILIVTGILLFLTNFLQVIPLILFLISGIMGLVRKID